MNQNYSMTADEAEQRTGLRAREITRPASESECGFDVRPRDPQMRYQLGHLRNELRRQEPIEGVCDAFEGRVDVFELVGFGRNWAAAVESAERRAKR